MNVSLYTIKEMIAFTNMAEGEIIRMAHKTNPIKCAQLSCEMKKAMTSYSKMQKTMDTVKLNFITVQAKLEKWVRKYFKKNKIKHYTQAGYDDVRVRKQVREDWQVFYNKYWRY